MDYPQSREEAEAEWPGLKPGRSCEVYGHHWEHYYTGPTVWRDGEPGKTYSSRCVHCEAEG